MRSPVEGESGDWVQSPHWAELFSVPLPGYSTQWADEDEKKKKTWPSIQERLSLLSSLFVWNEWYLNSSLFISVSALQIPLSLKIMEPKPNLSADLAEVFMHRNRQVSPPAAERCVWIGQLAVCSATLH